jgi:hypothetical protein
MVRFSAPGAHQFACEFAASEEVEKTIAVEMSHLAPAKREANSPEAVHSQTYPRNSYCGVLYGFHRTEAVRVSESGPGQE